MSETTADYLVIGSTLLARLLAGLLAGTHGKQVYFIGESQSGYRLPRNIDLSVAPITRPETWALLTQGVSETTKMVGRLGARGAMSRVNPVFFAEDIRAAEALSHMRHMAQAFGIAAEPVPPSALGSNRAGVTLRDALLFNRAALEPALDLWAEKQGALRLSLRDISVGKDGSAVIHLDKARLDARQTILADDAAIIAHLPLPQWPTLLRRQPTSTILTTPTRPLLSPVMLELDSLTLLLQQAEGGIAGIGPNDLAAFSSHMQVLLGSERQVEQAGQTSFQALVTMDGAPAVGRAAGVGADIVAGLGKSGAFFAPALARWLVGTAKGAEADWFGARLVNRSDTHGHVAEYASVGGTGI